MLKTTQKLPGTISITMFPQRGSKRVFARTTHAPNWGDVGECSTKGAVKEYLPGQRTPPTGGSSGLQNVPPKGQ